jgi:uncharacterized protein YjiS (DUF1127 family)
MSTMFPGAASASPGVGLARMFSLALDICSAALGEVRNAWARRQASILLHDLTPEMLKDIGISPGEIESALRHGRTGRPGPFEGLERNP